MTRIPDDPIRTDYDEDPGRFRLARSVQRNHGLGADVHGRVAHRLLAEGLTPVLDVGCGEGELARHLPAGAWVGLDSSPKMLARTPQPAKRGEATRLPFADSSFGSVTLLYVLYHLAQPAEALAEAHRVLRRGGLVVVAAPSRFDSPELAAVLARSGLTELTFDAELTEELLGEHFGEVEVERWDAPLVHLPTRAAVRDYLIGKGVESSEAQAEAAQVTVPITITKRGALGFARKI